MRRLVSALLALTLIIGGTIFTLIKVGYAPRFGAMGLFMIGVGIAWLVAEWKGD